MNLQCILPFNIHTEYLKINMRADPQTGVEGNKAALAEP